MRNYSIVLSFIEIIEDLSVARLMTGVEVRLQVQRLQVQRLQV